ncbi:hypothetical protein DL98DRAFT_634008 [Cadophora sp. DSE1049]|nr:hypothetical protein DL98DRAFT_634008 [Cadophora sp. DSE1049]
MAPKRRVTSTSRPRPSLQSPQSMIKVAVTPPKNPTLSGPPSLLSKTEFSVHKSFLCHYSPYFSKLLESADQIEIKIEDVCPVEFGVFVHWLYYQELKSLEALPDFYGFCKLWNLAEKLSVLALQNCAMDHLHKSVHIDDCELTWLSVYWKGALAIAAQTQSDKLRRLMRDIMVTTTELSALKKILKYASGEMIKDALYHRAGREIIPNIFKGLGPVSDYYVPISTVKTR